MQGPLCARRGRRVRRCTCGGVRCAPASVSWVRRFSRAPAAVEARSARLRRESTARRPSGAQVASAPTATAGAAGAAYAARCGRPSAGDMAHPAGQSTTVHCAGNPVRLAWAAGLRPGASASHPSARSQASRHKRHAFSRDACRLPHGASLNRHAKRVTRLAYHTRRHTSVTRQSVTVSASPQARARRHASGGDPLRWEPGITSPRVTVVASTERASHLEA
jgi:hypothetical protein